MRPVAPPRKHFIEPGQRFGRGVITDPEIRIGGERGARLLCDCGQQYQTRLANLTNGSTQSCGCLGHDWSHGLSRHPLYMTWAGMMHRCTDPKSLSYPDYGGRGIRVCDRWHDPAVFIRDIERWLGPRPEGMQLDRIQNDHDYRQDNVQWSTPKQQYANRRAPRKIGRQKLTGAQVREIRARYAAGGITQTALATEYGVSQTQVSDIITRKSWAEVP
jgi:hypothetical protein